MTETQQRFLKSISERVTAGRIAEVRLFPTVRTGQVDSGVAIVAVEDLAPGLPGGSGNAADADTPEVQAPEAVGDMDPQDPQSVGESGPSRSSGGESELTRLSILTARFRHTVKGPDRGKWEFDIVHDADAPLEAIERVVRGVASRTGEEGEPEFISGDDFLHALSEPWWTAAPR